MTLLPHTLMLNRTSVRRVHRARESVVTTRCTRMTSNVSAIVSTHRHSQATPEVSECSDSNQTVESATVLVRPQHRTRQEDEVREQRLGRGLVDNSP